jgi:hypothetical protein
MLIGLGIITWYPQLSVGLGNAIMGGDPNAMVDEDHDGIDDRGEAAGGMPTMEEMMREAMADDEDEDLEGEELEDEEVEELLEDEEAPEPDTTE